MRSAQGTARGDQTASVLLWAGHHDGHKHARNNGFKLLLTKDQTKRVRNQFAKLNARERSAVAYSAGVGVASGVE